VIPDHLLQHAGIEEQAMFVGLGRKFQIWNAAAYDKRREHARREVKDKALTLPRLNGEAA
jgi:MraZ protein